VGSERLIDGEIAKRQFVFFFENKSFHGGISCPPI
jgi:hypothetical protein